jgi:hypothetical protein
MRCKIGKVENDIVCSKAQILHWKLVIVQWDFKGSLDAS